jgi:hypothetical protein
MIGHSASLVSEPKTVVPGFVVYSGVLLPLAAIALELLTGISDSILGTLPTPWHLGLVLLVPCGVFASQRGIEMGQCENAHSLAWLTGLVAAVAWVYAVLLAPIIPLAIIGLPLLLPVLAFAPLLSFWAAIN